MRSVNLDLPDEDTEYQMYEDTAGILAEYGYQQYEISNYAKDGYACRHNIRLLETYENILAWGWEHLLFMGKTVFPIREICRNIWDFPETQNEFVKMF